MFSIKKLAAPVLLLGLSANAHAATEILSVTGNSTLATAQAVGDLELGAVETINVFGYRGFIDLGFVSFTDDSNADYYSFNINSASTLKLSVDSSEGPSNGSDPVLGLFDAAGTLLDSDDDSGPGLDSYLEYLISTPGTYIAAVSGYSDFTFAGGGDTDFSYVLQASIEEGSTSVVPVPAAFWLMGSSLLGFSVFGRKRAA